MMPDALPETILQFGTGKFLRGFADLFVHQANQGEQPAGRVVVLQSTGTERAAVLGRQGCRFRVAIRGLEAGRRVDEMVEVGSVSRALAAARDWDEVLRLAVSPSLATIISNTTEAGYALDDDDTPGAAPPRSFPAKLLRVLQARHEAGLPGMAILPCELLENNADRLLDLVLRQARRWGSSASLTGWLRTACRWHNTLVDRIVSAPKPDDPLAREDPLFAVAEPFALWLIDGSPDVPGLMGHPAVQAVDALGPYYLRKVRILNGAHTALVAKALPLGFETVRQAVEDAEIGAWLRRLLFEEIVPVVADRTEGAEEFARHTLERFANPFLDHRLADIALHHDVKLNTRLAPTYEEYRERFGRVPKLLGEVLGNTDPR